MRIITCFIKLKQMKTSHLCFLVPLTVDSVFKKNEKEVSKETLC